MTPRVLFEVPDGRGQSVQVLEPCWNHVLEGHPEMVGEEEAVRLTITDPDLVIRPKKRPKGRGIDRRVNCRLGAHRRYKELYVWVPINYTPGGNWMITAYVSSNTPKGEILFARVPLRWS